MLAVAATVVCFAPAFLTSALAVQLRSEFGINAAMLGAAIAAYRGTAAFLSPALGRMADRLGGARALFVAVLVAAVTAGAVVLLSTSWWALVACLALAGAAQAIVGPGANLLLSTSMPANRLSSSFGLKQAAPPTASMLAGMAVPIVAIAGGWRAAFVALAVAAIIVAGGAWAFDPRPVRSVQSAPKSTGRLPDRGTVVILALAFGCTTFASSSLSTFLVLSLVERGTAETVAGGILAVASVTAILVRLLTGWWGDRLIKGHLKVCAGVVAVGALGLVLMQSPSVLFVAVGAMVAMGGSWGFHGLFFYAIVRAYGAMPGRITGAVAPGGLIGGTVGPLAVGQMIETVGFSFAWATMAVVSAGAAVGLWLCSDRLAARGSETWSLEGE